VTYTAPTDAELQEGRRRAFLSPYGMYVRPMFEVIDLDDYGDMVTSIASWNPEEGWYT
jgi:hypothetical protein